MKIFRICKFLPTKLFFFKKKAASPIYLFDGILVDVVPECYIITMDGLESEPFADVAPYIFEDLGRAYAVVMDWLSLVMILLFVVSVIIAGRKSKDYKCRHCGKRFDRI